MLPVDGVGRWQGQGGAAPIVEVRPGADVSVGPAVCEALKGERQPGIVVSMAAETEPMAMEAALEAERMHREGEAERRRVPEYRQTLETDDASRP